VIAHSCLSQAKQQLRQIRPLCLRQRFFQLLADSTAHGVNLSFEDTLLGDIHMGRETGYPEVDWVKAAFAGSNPASFLELSLCESSAPKVVLTKVQDGPRGW
jgi:hypothetical protein